MRRQRRQTGHPLWPVLLLSLSLSLTAKADDIVVGMSAAFSGPSRALGIELYRGSMAYFEHVNQSGGILGRKILLKTYDDGYNPLPAIHNTLKLIDQDRAFLLMDYVGTPTVTRILPLLKMRENHSVFLFFPFTGALLQRVPPYDQYVFNLRASYHQETEGLVEQLLKLGLDRIGVLYQIDAYGRSGWEGVRKALAKHELQIVAESTYRRGTGYSESLREQVEILRSANTDAVISIGSYAACAAFTRDVRDQGWNVPIANLSFVGSESFIALLLETERQTGRDYTRNLVISQVVPSYEATSLPAVREYRELIQSHQPALPSNLTPEGYKPLALSSVSFEGFLNAKLLVEILKRLGDPPEQSRIRETVESIRNLDLGIERPISFGPAKHQGLDSVYFETVVDGRLVPLTDWESWLR